MQCVIYLVFTKQFSRRYFEGIQIRLLDGGTFLIFLEIHLIFITENSSFRICLTQYFHPAPNWVSIVGGFTFTSYIWSCKRDWNGILHKTLNSTNRAKQSYIFHITNIERKRKWEESATRRVAASIYHYNEELYKFSSLFVFNLITSF